MRDWLRTLIAGYAGWKWGGGCLGFFIVFGIVYFFTILVWKKMMFLIKRVKTRKPTENSVNFKSKNHIKV